MKRRKEKVFTTLLILMITGGWVFAQDAPAPDKRKHEIGVGTLLPAGSGGSSFLNFSYKYHFTRGALSTSLLLNMGKSTNFYDPEYYIRKDQLLGAFLGYELFKDFGRFRFSYGGDLGCFWERSVSGYVPEPGMQLDAEAEHSWSFGLRPFLGIAFRIVPGLSVSLESQAFFMYRLPNGFENGGENSHSYELGMMPLGLLSLNYHF
jgi:hypothetical protein